MENPAPVRLVEHGIRPSDIDQDARRVLRRLYDFGFHAYLVGGSVRDLLLDRTPKDFDVATSARPNEVRRLFRRCRLIGRRFRLAHVLGEGGKIIETATFRAKPPSDGDALLITDDNKFGTPYSDAHRRDFTINALFFDLARDEVIDYVGGLDDLKLRMLRTIGEPVVRLREDPVRMLRAVKFAARLDFGLERELRAAILSERGELKKAAVPRLYEEMRRLLWSGAARRCFELLDELRLLEVLLPELSGFLGRPGDDPWTPLRQLLDALDRRFEDPDKPPPDGLMFAVLLWPVFQALVAGLPEPLELADERSLAEAVLEPAARRLGVPRRTQETLLRIIEGQRRFRRARHDRQLRGLARDPDYAAIVAFAEMRTEAGDLAPELADAWSEFTDNHEPPPLERKQGRARRRSRGKRSGGRRRS